MTDMMEPRDVQFVPMELAQLPLGMPGGLRPRVTEPADVFVRVKAREEVQVVVLPYPAAVEQMLNDTYGPMGWTRRTYSCGGTLYCSVGVYSPALGDFVNKDAPALQDYDGKDHAKVADASAFWGAAAYWSVCKDVHELPAIKLRGEGLDIVAIPGKDGKTIIGYQLRQVLRVDKFDRNPDGTIRMVQFVDQHGKKLLWGEM